MINDIYTNQVAQNKDKFIYNTINFLTVFLLYKKIN